jgi:hypothetical protein
MKIIVINGPPQAGKDKFVSIFENVSGYRVKNFSSIDKVKSVAEICFGWNGKKEEKSRKFLSEMKRIWTEFNDGPYYYILDKIEVDTKFSLERKKDLDKNIYFLHIREPKEIDKIKRKFEKNCITLLIRKDAVDFIPDNESDKNVEDYEYDFIIENSGKEDELTKEVKKFIKQLKKM